MEAISKPKSFRADLGSDNPYIDIDLKDDGSLEFEFMEYGIVIDHGYDKATGKIIIGPCFNGVATDINATNTVNVMTHDYFASGFNSDGFENSEACAKFWISHVFGLGSDIGKNNAIDQISELNEVAGKFASYADIFFSAATDTMVDYQTGVDNAVFLEGQELMLEQGNVYNVFDCDACMVTYDIFTVDGTGIYAQAGRNTVVRVIEYNELTGNDYDIDYIISHPSKIHDEFTELINEDHGDGLGDIADGSYKDLIF